MTNYRIMLTLFIWMFFLFIACSTTKVTNAHTSNFDTFYNFSTQELRSDKIPDSVFNMTKLQHLSITGSDCDLIIFDSNGNNITKCWQIQKIPDEIKNLQELTTLDLTLNSIREIPFELTELKKLKFLSLTDNFGLKNITALTKIKGLEYLYLNGCGLSTIPDDIGDLKNLKELGLAGNNINKDVQERIKKSLPNCKVYF